MLGFLQQKAYGHGLLSHLVNKGMGQGPSSFNPLEIELLQRVDLCKSGLLPGDGLGLVQRVLQQQQVEGMWNLGFVQKMLQQVDLTQFLPEECMALIFSMLTVEDRNACSLVCKRWHYIDAASRYHLTLKARVDLFRDLPAILMRFEHITFLSLKWHRKSPSVDDETLELAGKLCKRLQRLNLKGCKALTDEGLESFSKSCRSLRAFSCGSCGFGARGLNALLQSCRELEDLSVKRLRRFIDNPKVIVTGGGKLKTLSLKDLFNAQLFGTLISSSKHLQTLVLARNPGYWDRLFELVVSNLTELVELHCQSLQLSDKAMYAISCCSKLEALTLIKLSDCTDFGIASIANRCGSLRKLHVDDRKTNCLGDRGLLSLANNCSLLRELILIGVDLSETSLDRIGCSCTELERLVLCNSKAVGDQEISCIAGTFRSLKRLCIKNCPISDHALEFLITGCPNLVKVKIKKCKCVTQDAVLWLQMNRPTLTVHLDESMRASQDVQQHNKHENHSGVIRVPTSLMCSSRPCYLKSKLTLATDGLFRKLPKSSCLPAG